MNTTKVLTLDEKNKIVSILEGFYNLYYDKHQELNKIKLENVISDFKEKKQKEFDSLKDIFVYISGKDKDFINKYGNLYYMIFSDLKDENYTNFYKIKQVLFRDTYHYFKYWEDGLLCSFKTKYPTKPIFMTNKTYEENLNTDMIKSINEKYNLAEYLEYEKFCGDNGLCADCINSYEKLSYVINHTVDEINIDSYIKHFYNKEIDEEYEKVKIDIKSSWRRFIFNLYKHETFMELDGYIAKYLSPNVVNINSVFVNL